MYNEHTLSTQCTIYGVRCVNERSRTSYIIHFFFKGHSPPTLKTMILSLWWSNYEVEEVSIKCMDRPRVTEMERKDVYEMALCLSIHFMDTSSIHFCDTWSVHQFHKHFLYLSFLECWISINHLLLLILTIVHPKWTINKTFKYCGYMLKLAEDNMMKEVEDI